MFSFFQVAQLKIMCAFLIMHTTSPSFWFYFPSNVWLRKKSMKPFIIHFFLPVSR